MSISCRPKGHTILTINVGNPFHYFGQRITIDKHEGITILLCRLLIIYLGKVDDYLSVICTIDGYSVVF